MTDNPFSCPSAVAAVTQAQVRDNAEAIADALGIVEAHLVLLADLDPAARGLALRETSRACESGVPDAVRLELGALQSEANAAFAKLRGTYAGLRETLVLLRQRSAAIGAAAVVIERRSHSP